MCYVLCKKPLTRGHIIVFYRREHQNDFSDVFAHLSQLLTHTKTSCLCGSCPDNL